MNHNWKTKEQNKKQWSQRWVVCRSQLFVIPLRRKLVFHFFTHESSPEIWLAMSHICVVENMHGQSIIIRKFVKSSKKKKLENTKFGSADFSDNPISSFTKNLVFAQWLLISLITELCWSEWRNFGHKRFLFFTKKWQHLHQQFLSFFFPSSQNTSICPADQI